MRISRLETPGKRETTNSRNYNIQTWGALNDHPQRLIEITAASITASSCLDTYAKFIEGRGFRDAEFFQAVVNRRGETPDDLLHKIAVDYARFGGFAIHVNFNAAGQVVEAFHMPFEWIRLEAMDNDGRFDKLAVHPDWGLRLTNLRRFDRRQIEFFDFFDPARAKEQGKKAGWSAWKGQILYYSNNGRRVYPDAVYSAAVTDMSSEEGLSNITYRNARHNFLPAGMLIDRNNNLESEEQENATRDELKRFQGDTNAGKLLYINLQGGDEPPEFKPFAATNTDTAYREANNNVPDRIGRAFCQPPILRAENVGSNFGATAMKEAYDFYNSQTETERNTVSRVFREVFSLWYTDINAADDYSIEAKRYAVTQTLAEQLGASTENVISVATSADLSDDRKRAILSVVYGIDADDIESLIAN